MIPALRASSPWTLALGVALLVSTTPALAQTKDAANAELLFKNARAFAAKGQNAEACPLFEESYHLAPATGTLLNVAMCHEVLGKTATAFAEYHTVASLSANSTPPRNDRVVLANKRATDLEPRLSLIAIVMADATLAASPVVRVDGGEKGHALWAALAVDFGEHTVEIRAPGRKPFERVVTIQKERQRVQVDVPALEDLPREPPAVGPVSASSVAPPSPGATASVAPSSSTRTVVGVGALGLGVVGVAAGAVFGALALSEKGKVDTCSAPCISGTERANSAQSAYERADGFANVANVAIPVGVVLAGVGALILLWPRHTDSNVDGRPRVAFHPWPAGGGVGATW